MFWTRAKKPHVHLVGIGGSGMSGIAEVLLASGFSVSGSDVRSSDTLERLKSLGACISHGHDVENLVNPEVVVVSSAVSANNVEVLAAKKKMIPVIPRAEMLAELMRLKRGVAVAGSHGKTTTTSLLGQLLRPLDPTVVVGGRLQHWEGSSISGKGNLFVIEADESDKSFLKFSSVYSIVTNIDREHLENYEDEGEIEKVFLEFLNRTAFFGRNWVCGDCPRLQSLKKKVSKPLTTYGFETSNDRRVTQLRFENGSSFFSIESDSETWGEFELPIVGEHNVLNAAAALCLALDLKLGATSLKRRLKSFVPADRRMQVHYRSDRTVVVEDYAHHPTEIRASLRSADLMFPGMRKVLLFQPHRFTRTAALWDDFVEVLSGLEELHLLPIYSAHEKALEGVSHKSLAAALGSSPVAVHSEDFNASDLLKTKKSEACVYMIMGASPLTHHAKALAELLREEERMALQIS